MLDSLATYTLLSFGALFAILSPFATVPAFLAMTETDTAGERIAMARRACGIACGVLLSFALVGLAILGFFRVTVPAFQIAGGLIVLRVGFEMIQGSRALKVTPEERREGAEKDDISVTPLAVPILCGPGTITTAILLSSQATTWLHTAILLADVIAIYAITFHMLRLASSYSHVLGETTLKIISRLMGLLLLAIAVQYVVDGIRGAALF